nr:PF10076 family protein [Escherichia coli 9.0111]
MPCCSCCLTGWHGISGRHPFLRLCAWASVIPRSVFPGPVTRCWTERFPDSSRLLLEDWERYLGLPECDMTGATIQERQRYAGNKYRMKPSLNREFYIRFAAEFGYEIDIQPSPDSQWVSIVTINSETGYRNMNVLDDILTPLRIYEGGALECILNRYKPAWQTFIYVYANSHEEETI